MAGFKDVLKHGGNYLIANLATRALAFISIPVYTRILEPSDYGVTAVFLATVGVLTPLIGLNFDTAIGRYYYDRRSDQDFKTFVGTSLIAALTLVACNSLTLTLLASRITEWTGLPQKVVYLLAPMAALNLIAGVFMQIFQPQKRSKPIALSSLSRVYLGFICSIGLIFIFRSEKYMGQILGQILAGSAMLIYWIRKIAPYVSWHFNRNHLRYILHYSVPLIPYVVSGVIVEQFGKLTIASHEGMAQAGFYTLAISIASLTAIVTEITHQAWYPYYMEYMQSGNYRQHDSDLRRIFRLTLVASLGFSCFGREIGLLLAKKSFTSALHLVPIISLGYVFHQLSYAYMRNISFSLKTGYMAVVVISSGCTNVLLNSVLIPRFGMEGAAISVALSYALMAFLSWFTSTRIIRVRGIAPGELLRPLCLLLLCFVPLYWILRSDGTFWITLLEKGVLFFVGTILLFWPERHFIPVLWEKIKTARLKNSSNG